MEDASHLFQLFVTALRSVIEVKPVQAVKPTLLASSKDAGMAAVAPEI